MASVLESLSTPEADREIWGAPRACVHCGLVTRRAAESSGDVFCCNGCRGAYQLIHHWGLQAYYDVRTDTGQEGPITPGERSYEDLDDPRLLGRSATTALATADDQPRLRCKLSIAGLHCAACVWLLEQSPRHVDGWHASTVHSHDRTIDVVFDPSEVKLSEIGRCLDRLGYQISPLAEPTLDADGVSDDESRRLLVDIAIAGFCSANAMWVAIALYAGTFTGIDPSHAMILRTAGVLLGAIAVLFPGRTFFRSAWASVAMRTPHMDLPVAIGLGAGLIASLIGLLDLKAEIYFDSIASLVFFLLVGRWFQMRQQRRAGDEVSGLLRMAPRAANRLNSDGAIERVAVDSLQVGDQVVVGVGESVPVDGDVIAGESLIDRSLLTGESRPIVVTAGGRVEAGTDNLQASLTVRASAVGEETRFAAIRSAVAQAAAQRTPIVQLANRIGGWFVVVVLLLATITAVVWSSIRPSAAIGNSVALLIVACPCALALATPLAIAVVIGRLAKRRILIRSGEALERLSRAGTIFFDKTGTLTVGRMAVTHWLGDRSVLPAVAAIESRVRHPIAAAIVAYFERDQPETVEIVTASDVSSTVGGGVRGIVSGCELAIGNAGFIGEASPAAEWNERVKAIRQSGASPVWIRRDGTIVAVAGVSDPVRAEAAAVLATLRRLGWHVAILSGDDRETVRQVGGELGVAPEDARGELLPQDKLAAVTSAARLGRVVMVGDGINDAAALAAADTGVAMRGGASASLTAAPVMIGDGQLGRVLDLIDAAGGLRRCIRRNFAVSIGYNLFAVVLAMTGLITPLIAAVLMPLSSLSVIAMTLSSRTFRDGEGLR